jgi:hypothetical protein
MDARPPTQTDLLPTGRRPAALGLVAAAIALMVFPAAVAVISIVDGGLLEGAYLWLGSTVAVAGPLTGVASLGLTLALAGPVGAAREDD